MTTPVTLRRLLRAAEGAPDRLALTSSVRSWLNNRSDDSSERSVAGQSKRESQTAGRLSPALAHPRKMKVGSASISLSKAATLPNWMLPASYGCHRLLRSAQCSDQSALAGWYRRCAMLPWVGSPGPSHGGRVSQRVTLLPRTWYSTLSWSPNCGGDCDSQ